MSAIGRLSFGRNHKPVWLVEYWVREFHHDADTKAQERKLGLREDSSANYALCHTTGNLTPLRSLGQHAMFEIPSRMAHNVAPVIAIPIFRAAFTISVSKLASELVVNMANAR